MTIAYIQPYNGVFPRVLKKLPRGENTVKGAKGAKVKVLFQKLHLTCVIFVLVYNYFKICI
jgi:hypothetical protein